MIKLARDYTVVIFGNTMELHGGSWRVHASALDDVALIIKGIEEISGGKKEVNVDKGKSSIGAMQTTIESKMNRKAALKSLKSISNDSWRKMTELRWIEKLDSEGNIHIRLELSKLVLGKLEIAPDNYSKRVVKGKFKIAHFPGEEIESVAKRLYRTLTE